MKIIYALLLLASTSVAVPSQSPASGQTGGTKPPFTLTIGADATRSASEDTSDKVVTAVLPSLWIRKTNTSHHEIIKWSTAVMTYGGYMCEVRDSRGNLIEPRKSNEVVTTSGGELSVRGTKDMVLQPGESKIDVLQVGSRYDVSLPGTYTIQVSSHTTNHPNSDVVKSNIIKVTVLPTNGPLTQQ